MDINSPGMRGSLETMHSDLTKAFLGYAHGGELGALASLKDGADNVRVLDAVRRSYTSRQVVEIS